MPTSSYSPVAQLTASTGEIERGVRHHARERHVVGLVVVALVLDQAHAVADALAAGGHAVDEVLVVGDGGKLGDVLVGGEQRVVLVAPVRERGAVRGDVF